MGFCPNCGKQIADGEVCTCQQNAAPVNASQPVSAAPATAAPKKSSNTLIIAAVAAVAVIAIIVILCVISSGAYKKPITGVEKMFNNRETNVDNIANTLLPKFLSSSYSSIIKTLKKSDDFSEIYDGLKDSFKDMYDDLEDEYDDKGWKVKFEVSSKKKIDSDDLEDIEKLYASLYKDSFKEVCKELEDFDDYDYEDMAEMLDIKKSDAKSLCNTIVKALKKFEDPKVKGGYTLSGRIIVTSSKGKTVEKTDKIDINVIKLNGSWMIDISSLPWYDINDLSVFDEFGDILGDLLSGYLYGAY